MAFVRLVAAVALATIVPGARAQEEACPSETDQIHQRLDEMSRRASACPHRSLLATSRERIHLLVGFELFRSNTWSV